MIALLKHKTKIRIGNVFHGMSIVEVKISTVSLASNLDRFSRLFNEGTKKYKVVKIYHQWSSKDTLKEINSILVLNDNTLIVEHKEIIRNLFGDKDEFTK